MSEEQQNCSRMNFQNMETDFPSEPETDEKEGDNEGDNGGDNKSEDFTSLQDTILSSLSPQTCELLRSGLPPLGDVFGDRCYNEFMLPTVQEVNSSEENRCSTPESVVLNMKPLEFYSLIRK